jgi:hypothetical protein
VSQRREHKPRTRTELGNALAAQQNAAVVRSDFFEHHAREIQVVTVDRSHEPAAAHSDQLAGFFCATVVGEQGGARSKDFQLVDQGRGERLLTKEEHRLNERWRSGFGTWYLA